MVLTAVIREWWAPWRCNESRLDTVAFPGVNKIWNLRVADASVPAWEAFVDVMAATNYLFRESAGGSYKCRPIGTSGEYSLHAYGLAVDLNPSANAQGQTGDDYPPEFKAGVFSIKTKKNGKQVFRNGVVFAIPDPMHWDINVSPDDLSEGVTGGIEDMADGPNGEPNWDKVSSWAQNSWTKAWKAGLLNNEADDNKDSDPQDMISKEVLMVHLDRAGVI